MDSVLKLIYDNQYYDSPGRRQEYLLNGVHPKVIEYIYSGLNEGKNLNDLIQEISRHNPNSKWDSFFRHSNFISYYRRQFNTTDFIKINDIKDDSCIYVWPVEVGASIDHIFQKATLNLNNEFIEYNFIDTIDPTVLAYMKQGKVKIMFNMIHDPLCNQSDLKNVETYFTDQGIDPANVIIIAGNTLDQYYKNNPSARIKVLHGYIMVQQAGDRLEHFPYVSSLGYVSDAVRDTDLNSNIIRPKKFLCWNRSMRQQRVLLAYLAHKYKLLDNSYFSFLNSPGGGEHTIRRIVEEYQNAYEADNYAKKIFDMLPYDLDTHHLEPHQKFGFPTNNNKKELYLNSYVHITSETVFYEEVSCPFFSEKTFHAMVNLQPFVYVGCPGALKQLHKWDIKTFAPFIDESYDDEYDPKKRFKMIEHEIKKLNDLSMQELHDWYYSIADILTHNQRALKQFSPTNPFEMAINSLKRMFE